MTSKLFPIVNTYVFFLLFSLNHLQSTNSSVALTPSETDRLALTAIRDGLQGLSKWNQSIHFCQWQGIRCDNFNQRVIGLDLSNQNLAGTISPHVGNLTSLTSLNLQNNNFYGEIPQEVGRLLNLQNLNIRNNSFQGNIPVNLSQCTNLKFIIISGNSLTGRIPPELGSLLKLLILDFAQNSLTGQIPPSLGNLSFLQIFSITKNRFEGSIPYTLSKLSSLTSFAISSNKLSGELPLPIYNISSINNLLIDGNSLTGSLPSNMGKMLPNLLVFKAGINRLSGHLPVSLTNASRLQHFDVMSNKLTGQVPIGLGALQSLEHINLGYNNLGSGEPDDLRFLSLTNSSNLKAIYLDKNNFGGVLPYSIANLSTRMETFYLGDNQISGNIPEGIGNLVNLIAFGLEQNHFTGSIPSSIGNIQKLQGLFLQGNKLTGVIPTSIGNLSQLSELSMDNNRLQGRIPSSLQGCRRLQVLSLSQNNLDGTIPEEVIGIASLSISLDLSRNDLTGSIPFGSGDLENLGHLDLSGNRLSGRIPAQISGCTNMEELHLENNLFEGEIDNGLFYLRGLVSLDLSGNILSGGIPTYFEALPYLERLNLSFNKFEGLVPTKGVFANATAISVAGNFKLCGGILELQLPACRGAKKRGSSIVLKVAIPLGAVFFSLYYGLNFLIFYMIPKSTQKQKPKRIASSSFQKIKHRYSKASYRDLYEATKGFSSSNCVGSGSFGCVYRGMLRKKGMMVAVKVFNLEKEGSLRSFMTECEVLRNIRHRNLIKVVTSCSSIDFEANDFIALVFEFMPYGTLDTWLHGADDGKNERWWIPNLLHRLNVATDVASALYYLQHQCQDLIIHCDLKPSNVLIDRDFAALVSDFGSAKLLSSSRGTDATARDLSTAMVLLESTNNLHTDQSATFRIKGTIGYIAPESGMGCEASIQSDVYSFGILVLETFTGKRPTNEMFKDGLNLHNYARNALPDQVSQIVDPTVLTIEDEIAGASNSSDRKDQVLECLTAVIRIGVACSVESPKERMDIRDVIKELSNIRKKMNLDTRMRV